MYMLSGVPTALPAVGPHHPQRYTALVAGDPAVRWVEVSCACGISFRSAAGSTYAEMMLSAWEEGHGHAA